MHYIQPEKKNETKCRRNELQATIETKIINKNKIEKSSCSGICKFNWNLNVFECGWKFNRVYDAD